MQKNSFLSLPYSSLTVLMVLRLSISFGSEAPIQYSPPILSALTGLPIQPFQPTFLMLWISIMDGLTKNTNS